MFVHDAAFCADSFAWYKASAETGLNTFSSESLLNIRGPKSANNVATSKAVACSDAGSYPMAA